jgi:hypothetical protein
MSGGFNNAGKTGKYAKLLRFECDGSHFRALNEKEMILDRRESHMVKWDRIEVLR